MDLINTSESEARALAEMMRRSISSMSWSVDDLRVTISGGLITRQSDDDLESLLVKVDTALYSAKSGGKDMII